MAKRSTTYGPKTLLNQANLSLDLRKALSYVKNMKRFSCLYALFFVLSPLPVMANDFIIGQLEKTSSGVYEDCIKDVCHELPHVTYELKSSVGAEPSLTIDFKKAIITTGSPRLGTATKKIGYKAIVHFEEKSHEFAYQILDEKKQFWLKAPIGDIVPFQYRTTHEDRRVGNDGPKEMHQIGILDVGKHRGEDIFSFKIVGKLIDPATTNDGPRAWD